MKGPWGPWATLGWGVLLFLAWLGAQFVATIAGVLAGKGGVAGYDGDLLWLATLVSTAFEVPLILAVIRLRDGPEIPEYLALRRIGWKHRLLWPFLALLLLVAWELLHRALERPPVEFMLEVYRSSRVRPALWLAVAVAAPLSEEIFYRGFLHEGFRRSRLGEAGAVAATSLLWTLIHFQYGLFELAQIFSLGLLLGWARVRSGSLLPPLGVHALWNLAAMIATHFEAGCGRLHASWSP